MAWERGYYYRVRRENGRVVREYVGHGWHAEIIAQLDELERENASYEKQVAADALRKEKARSDKLDINIDALDELADFVARAALIAAGYHQHKRGEWRKRRGRHDKDA